MSIIVNADVTVLKTNSRLDYGDNDGKPLELWLY